MTITSRQEVVCIAKLQVRALISQVREDCVPGAKLRCVGPAGQCNDKVQESSKKVKEFRALRRNPCQVESDQGRGASCVDCNAMVKSGCE